VLVAGGLLLLGLTLAVNAGADAVRLNLYAGAGLKRPMDVVVERFEKAYGVDVIPNYGSSGGLYAQISQGQPCDLFLSADWSFIQRLEKDGRLAEGKKFLTDAVVLVVSPTGEKKVHSFDDLTQENVVLTVADPRAPVGRYAEKGLKKLGLWEPILSRRNLKARPTTVNQLALMVQKDQVDAGLLFKSVANMYGLKYVATMGPELTGEIVFGFGVIRGGNEALARKLMAFALQPEQAAEFTKFGWRVYE
jgi:molybdate transport system substrate-binding protein